MINSLNTINSFNYLKNKIGLKGNKKCVGNSLSSDFNRLLELSADMEQASDISQKYGVSVQVQSIPKDENEIVRRGTGGLLNDVVIAPNILEKMKTNSSLRNKIEGYLEFFTGADKAAFLRLEQLCGVRIVGRSLVIHEDGSYTIWSASETSLEEVEKAKKIEAEKLKKKYIQQHIYLSTTYKTMNWMHPFSTCQSSAEGFLKNQIGDSYFAILPFLKESQKVYKKYI